MTVFRTAIVTGAYGFIGSHVAARLEVQGAHVRRVGRGDDLSWDTIPDLLVHCAGPGTVGKVAADPHADFLSSVAETENLLNEVARHAPKARIVFCSSAAVYGNESTDVLKETDYPRPVSAYGTHKLMNELLLTQRCRQWGLFGSAVRLFSVYGDGMRKQILWDGCKKLLAGETQFHGTGNEVRDFVHIDDVVSLLLMAAEHASADCPIVNGGTGQGVTVREVLSQISSNLGCSAAPNFTGRVRPDDPMRLCADVSQLQKWDFASSIVWQSGVREYCEWFLEANR